MRLRLRIELWAEGEQEELQDLQRRVQEQGLQMMAETTFSVDGPLLEDVLQNMRDLKQIARRSLARKEGG